MVEFPRESYHLFEKYLAHSLPIPVKDIINKAKVNKKSICSLQNNGIPSFSIPRKNNPAL